jgi:hypothetical protein
MNAIIRNMGPRGARFYDDNGVLMFVNVVDASTRDGPREATDDDRMANPEAYAKMDASTEDMFPGAKPLITFTGERPASAPNPELLAKPPEPEPKRVKAG